MPVIRIEYDNQVVNETDARLLCEAAQRIVSETTGIADVFVYGNSSHIKVNIAPIEIWVEMSNFKITDADALVKELRVKFETWKADSGYQHTINLTLIPMRWSVEVGI